MTILSGSFMETFLMRERSSSVWGSKLPVLARYCMSSSAWHSSCRNLLILSIDFRYLLSAEKYFFSDSLQNLHYWCLICFFVASLLFSWLEWTFLSFSSNSDKFAKISRGSTFCSTIEKSIFLVPKGGLKGAVGYFCWGCWFETRWRSCSLSFWWFNLSFYFMGRFWCSSCASWLSFASSFKLNYIAAVSAFIKIDVFCSCSC